MRTHTNFHAKTKMKIYSNYIEIFIIKHILKIKILNNLFYESDNRIEEIIVDRFLQYVTRNIIDKLIQRSRLTYINLNSK